MIGTRKSNLLGKITVFVFICFFGLSAQGKYGGGTGELNDPYLIYTAEQMNAIGADSNDWDKHFKLMADIDLSAYTGASFNIIGYYVKYNDNKPFTGVFDGNDHTISNFTYDSNNTFVTGLFRYVRDPNAEIRNLGLINPNVDAGTKNGIGSLVGWLHKGTISACYAKGASVSGRHRIGGLVGMNYGTITKCYSSGSVMGNKYLGGLVGENFRGTIINSYSAGSVSGNYRVGGLVGDNNGKISNSYSTAGVTGDDCVGGLSGYNYATITYCYSNGTVFGNWDVGGLVGSNYYGSVSGCFWDIQTSGQTTSAGGTGKTTDQMKDLNTFLYWGVCGNKGVWTINDGNDYPRLAWQNLTGVLIVTSEPVYGGGSGNEADPYQIWTAEQLNKIGLIPCHWDKHFMLMADIDLSGFGGSEFNIIGYVIGFSGVFEGNGHTISNFTFMSTGRNNTGLFGYVFGPGAEIKNLGLIGTNVHVGTGDDVGSLVGQLDLGTISNCYVEGGSVAGDQTVGGLVGNNSGKITNCYAMGSVFGDYHVGGLVGNNDNIIVDCYTSGNVTGSYIVGGLCGKSTGPHHGTGQSRIQNCFNKATVTGNSIVGGLIGHSGAIVTGCYSTGSVIVRDDYSWSIGGLIGRNGGNGSIINCYSTGSVVGDGGGGLVGYNQGTVWASFWDIETSGQTTSDGGTGLTTAEMQTASTFVCWGCCGEWTIDEGNDYPRLSWEKTPGEPIVCRFEGKGTPDKPYLIYTAQQFNMIGLSACVWDKHFKLMADIDLSSYSGTAFNIIGNFTGVFDGSDHTISNFTYTSTDRNSIGLFGCVSGVIKDLGLINPNVDAGTGTLVGSLVGELWYGTISNCYIEGGSVSGDYSVGGLVGRNSRGTITNSYSTGSVSGDRYVGGLVGYTYKGSITDCYSNDSVSGRYDVGGLVGYNAGKVSNSYSNAGVSGDYSVGGLVGRNYRTIISCYSTGSVSGGERVGGLVGDNSGHVVASFWDIETSGQSTSAGGTGLPTAEMQMEDTFTDAGWDFVGETLNGIEDIWFIPQQDYPHLWWEGMQVPMKLTPRTLNCRSYGNWVKAHLILPQGVSVEDIDSNRPAVLHSFGFESAPLYVFVNKNKLVQIEAAFEREAVCSLAGDWPQMLTVAGFLADGNIFLGSSTVRIIHPGMKVIEELAWYWLNADCVQPDFCDQIDMNRDSIVNLLDYALLMNIEVEFVTDE